MNDYCNGKNYAKGLINFALLLANANQLRYALAIESDPFRTANIVLICLSIGLQVAAGILLILDHAKKIAFEEDLKKCNNYTTAISIINLIITVINVIIISFGGPEMPKSPDLLNSHQNITQN